jgi:hypothetical protein
MSALEETVEVKSDIEQSKRSSLVEEVKEEDSDDVIHSAPELESKDEDGMLLLKLIGPEEIDEDPLLEVSNDRVEEE